MTARLPRFAARWLDRLRNLTVFDRRDLYMLWEQEHLRRLLKHYAVDCVFDVGANTGQYASMLRRQVGYRGLIVSFEPNPLAADAARRRAAQDPRWHVEEIALSSADGEQSFNLMNDSQFSSLSAPRHTEALKELQRKNSVSRSVVVKTETVTTAFRRLQERHGFQRPFLKLDTQGYDVEIIRAAGPALAQFVGLQSELAVQGLYEKSVDFREAISVYEQCGFQLSAFVPNNRGHFPHLIETDCIMVRAGAR